MEFTGKTKYLIERRKMIIDISELASIAFSDVDSDPEFEWSFFREQLKVLKKEHTKQYLEYMESDAED
jgi:hypothetical protein